MTITKTLGRACLIALALGAGVANAQNLTPGSNEGDYWAAQNRMASQSAGHQVQAGSVDVGQTRSGANHAATFILRHSPG
jgi:hypothetical protein